MYVYVINQHGQPLMPCRPQKARVLLKEGKAYVAIPIKLMDESNSAKFEMLFDDDMNGDDENETTGIEAVISEAENNSEIWYSLKGERLSGKPTQKGLYICNGKKVIIK